MEQTAHDRADWPTRQKAWSLLKLHPEGLTPLESALMGNYKFTSYMSDLIGAGYPIKKIRLKRPATIRYKVKT